MDTEVLYSIFGVVGFLIVAYLTLKAGGSNKVPRSKEEKRAEIIQKYKTALQKSLKDYDINDEERTAKKIMLLRGYSEELHFNIFFDEDEVKDIIKELSAE